VIWRAFELDPQAPPVRDVDAATHLAQKYGMAREDALARQDQLARLGAADGLEFRFDLQRGGNTFDGHRLIALAATHGLADAMTDRLFRANFAEGLPVGDRATLERLAGEVGLPDGEARETLAGYRFAAEVREDEQAAARIGIRGVPFFAVDRQVGASGAQSVDVLVQVLEQGRAAAAS